MDLLCRTSKSLDPRAELWPVPNVPTQASACCSGEEEREEESWTLFNAAEPAANYCSERRNTFPSAGSHFCFPSAEREALRRTASSQQRQPAAAASSFLSHWKLLKLFRASLSVKCCSGTWKSFPFPAKRLLVLFSSDQLMPWMIWFHQLLRGISGYLSAEGWTVFTTKILCLLFSAGKGAHSGIRF